MGISTSFFFREMQSLTNPTYDGGALPPVCKFFERYSRGAQPYPRQRTLLKIFFLETESLSDFDHMVIEEWLESTRNGGEVIIPTDIYDRMEWCKRNGYHHFHEIIFCGGRRGGKGFLGGKIAEYKIAQMISLGNPQRYYGIDDAKNMYLDVLATQYSQAQGMLYNDIKDAVLMNDWLAPYLYRTSNGQQILRTPNDIARANMLDRRNGSSMMATVASIHIEPSAASSSAIRGRASFMQCFDEFAHGLDTGSNQSSGEIYNAATPSLQQFDKDGLIYIPSSPWSKGGKFYDLYQAAFAMEGGSAVNPQMIAIKMPSWAPYAQPLDAMVLTPRGFVEMGSITAGDFVIGSDGRMTEVEAIHPFGEQDVYEVLFSNGAKTRCTADHLWTVRVFEDGVYETKTLSTSDIQAMVSEGIVVDLPESPIIRFSMRPEPPFPYMMGNYLGGIGNWEPIPLEYMYASPDSRWEFAQGFIDKCGIESFDGRMVAISVNSNDILSDFCFVMRSLGCDVSMSVESERNLVEFNLPKWLTFPYMSCGLSEIWDSERADVKPCRLAFSDISYIGMSEVQCITVSNDDGLYVTDDFILTHNCSWEYDHRFKKAIILPPELSQELRSRESLDPEKFDVEFRANFAETENAYMQPQIVESLFSDYPETGNRNLPIDRGLITQRYRVHADAGRSQDNFCCAIGHKFIGDDGMYHVQIDLMKVWQHTDFDEDEQGVKRIDYTVPMAWFKKMMKLFYVDKFTMDQWNSGMFVDELRACSIKGQFLNKATAVSVDSHTASSNTKRWELFKTACYQGWVHIPRVEDNIAGIGRICLVEKELKSLVMRNGKVDMPREGWGHGDMADCVSTIVADLLGDQLNHLETGDVAAVVGAAQGGYNSVNREQNLLTQEQMVRGSEMMRQLGYRF